MWKVTSCLGFDCETSICIKINIIITYRLATHLVVATQQYFRNVTELIAKLDITLTKQVNTLSSCVDNNNSLVLSSTALALWSKPKMRKIRTTGSFYGKLDERGRHTRSHTGSTTTRPSTSEEASSRKPGRQHAKLSTQAKSDSAATLLSSLTTHRSTVSLQVLSVMPIQWCLHRLPPLCMKSTLMRCKSCNRNCASCTN